jgi:hypothetical protein
MAKNTSKVGSYTKKIGPISTPYVDVAVPKPDKAGHGVAVRNGIDIAGGAKGTPGEMPEVTIVDVKGGAPGTKATGAKIANRSKF